MKRSANSPLRWARNWTRLICNTSAALSVVVALAALAHFSLLTPMVRAQESTGSIAGTVIDQTGAVIPGANITITNQGTGEAKRVAANGTGGYVVASLVPGNYQIDVQASGFKHFRRAPIDVQVATTAHLDISMEIGQASEVVTVTSQAALIQTESSSVGQVIEGRTVQDTPLNGRNIMNMLAIDPGVIPQGATSGSTQGNQNGGGHTNAAGYGNYQIGGGLAGMSAQFLDGVPLNMLGANEVAFVPTQDFVQEFKAETNNVSPQFGRFSGGVVTMTSKTGTNQVHGTAYEYIRNTVFDANDFFSNLYGSPRTSLHQNQYGVAGGGPIKHEKMFYFGSFDRYAYSAGYPYSTDVPTVAEKTNGDFSALLGPAIGTNPCDGSSIYANQIFDPKSTQTVGGVVCRTAFPNNKIPQGSWDSTANYILNTAKYFPDPTPGATGAYNYFSTSPIGGSQWQINGRGDYSLSDKQHIFIRYAYLDLNDISQNVFKNVTGNPPGFDRMHQGVIGHTWTITPTMILDTRVSYTRNNNGSIPMTAGANLTGYGPAWVSLGAQAALQVIPNVQLPNFDPLMSHQAGFGYDYYNSYVISSNLTKTFAKHTIDAGVDLRLLNENGVSGQPYMMVFAGGWTSIDSGLNSASPANGSTGFQVADLLLGAVTFGNAVAAIRTSSYERYQAYYVTDTYRINRRLTLNGGVRWEIPGAYYEGRDRAVVLLPNATDPLGSAVGMSLKGQLAFVNSSAYAPRTLMVHHYALFGPRMGFNYELTHGTVLHGGYPLRAKDLVTSNERDHGCRFDPQSLHCGRPDSGCRFVSGQARWPDGEEVPGARNRNVAAALFDHSHMLDAYTNRCPLPRQALAGRSD